MKKLSGRTMRGIFSVTVFLFTIVCAVNTQQNLKQGNQTTRFPVKSYKKVAVAKTKKTTVVSTKSPLIAKAHASTSQAENDYCLTVPVLLYHHIEPYDLATKAGHAALTVDTAFFDEQMSYLTAQGYTTLTAQQLVEALRSRTQLPAKSILVTLDDGYKDAYYYAYPILQKYRVTANLMIPTGLVGGNDYLTWDQINEMLGSGLIFLTDHSWSHYAVGRGSSKDTTKFEIETGKQQLEQHTKQHTVNIFTYPYGSYSDEAIKILQEDGFTGAFSTDAGTYQCASFIMTLHRTRIGNSSLMYYGL